MCGRETCKVVDDASSTWWKSCCAGDRRWCRIYDLEEALEMSNQRTWLYDLNQPGDLRDAVAYLLDKDGGPDEHKPQNDEEAEARGLSGKSVDKPVDKPVKPKVEGNQAP